MAPPYLNVANQSGHFVGGAVAESPLDDCLARGRQHDHQGRVHDGARRQHGQYDEPEPQENVDLLVQNVERQQAQGVVLLDAARRPVLVERALGEPRKHLHHRIGPVLLVHAREVDDVRAVRQKGAAQKLVHKDDVHDDVGQVQQLAEEVAERVAVVRAQAFQHVVDEALLAAEPLLGRQREHAADALRDDVDLAVLPVLPDPVGHVE